MKKIFIIGGYPKSKKQIQLLKDCISSVALIEWDILLVSHCPVPVEIQEMVTYCIYDNNNSFVPPNISPHIYLSNDSFDSKFYLGGHALAVSINIFNGFKFAQNYGFDFCYYMEFDSILSPEDLNKLKILSNEIEIHDKDMVIFNPQDFVVRDCYYNEEGPFFYETLLFGAKIDQFLSIFNPPKNLKEWMDNDMCYNLESTLHHKYKDLKDRCLIIPSFVEEYLTESKINSHRFGLFVCGVISNESNPKSPVLLINNLSGSNTTKVVEVYLNDIRINCIDSFPGTWYYLPLSLDGSKLKIEVLEDGQMESSEEIYLTLDLEESLKEKLSYIKFK